MNAVALVLHVLGAVVWVGGMFAAYLCLRPAAGTLDPPVRLKLWRAFFAKFLPWVWIAILLLLAGGYWMVFMTFGGFAGCGLHINLMQAVGWVMTALFLWLFHGPRLKFKRAADASDWPTAGGEPQPHPPDHRGQPAARPARRRHRRERPLLGLTIGRDSRVGAFRVRAASLFLNGRRNGSMIALLSGSRRKILGGRK